MMGGPLHCFNKMVMGGGIGGPVAEGGNKSNTREY